MTCIQFNVILVLFPMTCLKYVNLKSRCLKAISYSPNLHMTQLLIFLNKTGRLRWKRFCATPAPKWYHYSCSWLSVCWVPAAFTYLGVASRAASTLGPHQKGQYITCTKEEAEVS